MKPERADGRILQSGGGHELRSLCQSQVSMETKLPPLGAVTHPLPSAHNPNFYTMQIRQPKSKISSVQEDILGLNLKHVCVKR